MSALMGTFVKLQTMADGTPRVILEMQCSLTEIAALNLVPGAPFALARLAAGATSAPQPESEEKPKGGPLAKLAGMWCQEKSFWDFLNSAGHVVHDETDARSAICGFCGIGSRAELDSNPTAAEIFQSDFRLPYMSYMQRKAA